MYQRAWSILIRTINARLSSTYDLAQGRDDVVLAHLNHRLVTMSLRLLRAEVWSSDEQRKLYRVTARTVPSHIAGYTCRDRPCSLAHPGRR